MFNKLSDLLPKIAAKKGLLRAMNSAQICQAVRLSIIKHWGDGGLKLFRPKFYKNRNVFVETLNSAYANEFQTKKHLVFEDLKTKFPALPLENIYILTKNFSANDESTA